MYWDGFFSAFVMILISEFCDKTFFLAAVLSMRSRRHDKVKVFLGSILALALMSLLSVLLGGFIFTWIPMLYTKIASTLLFFMFSVLMVREAILSQPSTASSLAVSSSTLSPARIEREQEGSHSFTSVLSFRDNDKHEDSDNDKNKEQSKKPGEFLFSKSFILTLIAEWGDRSQLATIALATSKVRYLKFRQIESARCTFRIHFRPHYLYWDCCYRWFIYCYSTFHQKRWNILFYL